MANTLSFFDPALVERWGAAFIREKKVDESLSRLIPNVRISRGHFSYPGNSELRDLVWNHMDQNHRPLIHRTYGEAMRVFISKEAAFTLTRFGRWPIILPVFDGYFKDNGFYQVMCLFGLIVVICTIECKEVGGKTQMDVDWAIASHRLLRFFHPLLSRRLLKLNNVQNREDDEIRDRRIALRSLGYRFSTDAPNFISANVVANNVIFPPIQDVHSASVADFADGEVRSVSLGDRAYIVRRKGDALEVWPGICPHEGAAMKEGDVHGMTIKCPWHGLEFGARRLVQEGPPVTMCGAQIRLSDMTLTMQAAQTASAQS